MIPNYDILDNIVIILMFEYFYYNNFKTTIPNIIKQEI